MVFALTQPSFPLSWEEQKTLHAFGRTVFSRKSNLAIESLLTPTQVDTAVNHLAEKGLVRVQPSNNTEGDERVYLTWKGGQIKRQIGNNVLEFPTTVEPNIDDKLKQQIAHLKEKS